MPQKGNINAASQELIGSFGADAPRLKVTAEEEMNVVKSWHFVSPQSLELELLELLTYEDVHGPAPLESDAGNCCSIL